MGDKILFSDEIDKRKSVRDKVFLLIFGSILIGLATFVVFRIILEPIAIYISLIPIIMFIYLVLKKDLGIKHEHYITISETGIRFLDNDSFYNWKNIDEVEILKGAELGISTHLPTLAVIQGDNVSATPLNISNRDLKKLKEIIEKQGVGVKIR